MSADIMGQAIAFGIAITGFAGIMAAAMRSPIGKFILKVFRRELNDLMLTAANAANQPLQEQIAKLDSYTRYHLGPNGESKPVHKRLELLEEKALITGNDIKHLQE